jgi:hypothetical protein
MQRDEPRRAYADRPGLRNARIASATLERDAQATLSPILCVVRGGDLPPTESEYLEFDEALPPDWLTEEIATKV